MILRFRLLREITVKFTIGTKQLAKQKILKEMGFRFNLTLF